MFKKTMKFDNLDGEEVTQTFYFNYNKKEIAELLEFGAIQDYADPNKQYLPLEEQLKRLSMSTEDSGLSQVENNRQAYRIFQDLLLDAYGVKGEDNVSFDKSPALRHYWSTHVAFPELVFEFLENPQLAAQFIENCLPPRMVAAAKEEMQRENSGKLSSETLTAMVEEAAERQKNPATRIEPGPEAAASALGENPEVAQLAQQVKDEGVVVEDSEPPRKRTEDLTEDDIAEMSDEDFVKLDPSKLSPAAMMAGFRRKTKR